jgi:hypothetical protein
MKGFNLQKDALIGEHTARELITMGYGRCAFAKSTVVIVHAGNGDPYIVQGAPSVVLGEAEMTLKNQNGKVVAWAICTHEDLT